tara:strand:+ start:261 stop:674 length:414 start_codon:yes stop_codon:yes gene_type:complete
MFFAFLGEFISTMPTPLNPKILFLSPALRFHATTYGAIFLRCARSNKHGIATAALIFFAVTPVPLVPFKTGAVTFFSTLLGTIPLTRTCLFCKGCTTNLAIFESEIISQYFGVMILISVVLLATLGGAKNLIGLPLS